MKIKTIRIDGKKAFLALLVAMLTVSMISMLPAQTEQIDAVTKVRVEPVLNEFGNSAGDPIPIPGTQFTISVKIINVASLYGFDIQFRWNTTYLQHVSHSVHVPKDTYPDGVLWNPVLPVTDLLNTTTGIYWLAKASMFPAPVFNGNGTVFTMTFNVKKQPFDYETGGPGIDFVQFLLDFVSTDLSDDTGKPIVHDREPATVKIWEQRSPVVVKVVPTLSEFGNSAGDRIPIPGTQFTVKVNITNVANLYGFDLKLGWNTTYLSHVSHLVYVPRDVIIPGVLWKPYQAIKDEVNSAAGTLWVNYTSLSPAPSFNGSGTIFQITFEIIKQSYNNETGTLAIEPVDVFLNLTSTSLVDKAGAPIDHLTQNATVRIWEKRWLPIVMVDPALIEYSTSAVGQNFTVAVKIIGVENLYGFDIQISWNTQYLEYVSHTVTVPKNETFPGGVLYEPVLPVVDIVDTINGKYQIAYASMSPAPSFNGSGTVFNMTFMLKDQPIEPEPTVNLPITIVSSDLASPGIPSLPIEHDRQNGLVILWQLPFSLKPRLIVQPSKTVLSGGTFQINITIDNLEAWWELKGFDVKLGFNASSLQALSIIEGPFLKSFGDTMLIINMTNNIDGYVWIAVSQLNYTTTPKGSGVLATALFNMTSQATNSDLTLYETQLASNPNQTKWGTPWSMPISHTTQDGTFIADYIAPVVAITYPTGGAYIKPPIWINGTVAEANMDEQEPEINDTRFTLDYWDPLTGDFAFMNNTVIADGPISVKVSFTDLAAHTGEDTVTFTLDTTSPSISEPYQTPPGQIMEPDVIVEIDEGQNVTVTVNVTDLGSGVKEVTLFYNTSMTDWASIVMENTAADEYEATIPSSDLPWGTTVIYYVTASDNVDNAAATPTSGIYFKYHVIPEFTAIIFLALMMVSSALAMIYVKARKTKRYV